MKRATLLLSRSLIVLLLLSLASTTVACKGQKKHWWEFWKKGGRVYPNDVLPFPDSSPATGSTEGLPGQLAQAEPIRNAEGTPVSQLQPILFDFDSFAISPEMQQRLDQNAQWILANAGTTIQIEGHCDERGSSEYNIALGQKRADTVREYLATKGVDAASLTTISYGEERPIDPGKSEDAYAKNRRVQFLAY
jgi:peptidoglycan-associated lipoprotein